MEKYKKILAVIDPTTEHQKALERAVELANKTGATITAFMCIYDFSYEMTTMLSSDEREAMRQTVIKDRELWLQEKITSLPKNSLTIDFKVVWHNRPFEPIIEQVLTQGFDIVLKGTHEHHKLKSVIFTPTDWHLIRKCPSPVLLVKEHSWPKGGNILAAVHVGSDEKEHQALNNKITEEAINLSKIIDANVHLVNSFPGTPVNIAIEIPEFNAGEYNESMLNHHKVAMANHAQKFGVDSTHTHVEEGLPEEVIQHQAEKLDAELVILGTIGRTGISAALIGNTAEHVIDNLDCDVLALKPEGYVSPMAQ